MPEKVERRILGDPLDLGAHENGRALVVRGPSKHGVRDIGDERAELLLAFPNCLLGLLPFGDISHVAVHGSGLDDREEEQADRAATEVDLEPHLVNNEPRMTTPRDVLHVDRLEEVGRVLEVEGSGHLERRLVRVQDRPGWGEFQDRVRIEAREGLHTSGLFGSHAGHRTGLGGGAWVVTPQDSVARAPQQACGRTEDASRARSGVRAHSRLRNRRWSARRLIRGPSESAP